MWLCSLVALNNDLERHLNAFEAKCLRRIMGYHYFVSNQRFLGESGSRSGSGIVRNANIGILARGTFPGGRACLVEV